MKVERIAECSPWSILHIDLHKAIIGIENQFPVSLRVAIYTGFHCGTLKLLEGH